MTCYQKSRTQNIQYAPVPNGTFGHPAGNNAGQAAGYPSQSNPPSNPPKIQSDYFVSHTQRNGQATTLATDLHASLKENGMNVWLDVKMENRSMTAMKEGVVNSSCVIAVITGPCHNPDDPDALPGTNAYFSRPFCVQELRWAKEAQIPIQPVIRAADKSRIGELMALAPDDLQFVGNIDFITLDRSDVDYWEVGIQKILRAANKVKRTPSGQGAAAAPGLAQPFYPGAPPPPYMVPAAAATPYYTAPYTTSPPPTAPLMVTDMPTYGSSIHRETIVTTTTTIAIATVGTSSSASSTAIIVSSFVQPRTFSLRSQLSRDSRRTTPIAGESPGTLLGPLVTSTINRGVQVCKRIARDVGRAQMRMQIDAE
eukprot:CAMPEP_0206307110 /NCGR_PEP_ID=MMETSP0106_2-20121207/11156_1 /ASSEMBLY_ACC=CAM_ASM_000206 /TAXON_ID=81532 /ORGANISM="Acanthoeca-like sp., Strain 10tr" /LENGTH=368 /DNA_ID=CAMNT_0053738071 /DNA_START=715 /DNA_END=1819 /DNA_ORIENTATION=+